MSPEVQEGSTETQNFKHKIMKSMGEAIDQKINEYSSTVEEAFKTLNEVMKEVELLKSDVDVDVLKNLEDQKPAKGYQANEDSNDIIRLS